MSRRLAFALASLVLLGCSGEATRPQVGRVETDTSASSGTSQTGENTGTFRLIACPTNETVTNSGVLGTLGGTVSAAGSSITLPLAAVVGPTLIRVTVPTSSYMEIDVTANDLLSFLFRKSVTITIDYSRCLPSVTQGKTLTVWHIDTQTKALLENMNAVNDPVARRITFTTDHLSGYAIAQ